MLSLVELPHEVLHEILRNVEAIDIASVAFCCKSLHHFTHKNRLLFRDLYLKTFDDPIGRSGVSDAEYQWEDELPRIVKTCKILETKNADLKIAHAEFVLQTIEHLLRTASKTASLNIGFLGQAFLGDSFPVSENREALLCQSSLVKEARYANNHPEKGRRLRSTSYQQRKLAQISSKLQCLYGVWVPEDLRLKPEEETEEPRPIPLYAFACSRVYDLRRYTTKTLWGPFKDDGSQEVDWEKMEAVMMVLDHNMRAFSHRMNGAFTHVWKVPFAGVSPDSFVSRTPKGINPEPRPPLDAQDPYGVTGTWMRVVCFLDYPELFAFNFTSQTLALDEDRPPLDTQEAIRLIIMKLRVTAIEPPGEADGQGLPVVYFKGTSRSLHASWDPNANSDIRGQWQHRGTKGSVRLTPEGEVRWTTFSVYHGEERWRSEGIQMGGVRSARGVIGNWFEKDYDLQGPAGPTVFWKMSDDIDDEKPLRVLFV